MKAAEKGCHKYLGGWVEWSPEAGLWLKRRWLLARVQVFLNGNTRDTQNLYAACHWHRIKDPRHITQDELNTKFFICKTILTSK
jgi:hypothetical protein